MVDEVNLSWQSSTPGDPWPYLRLTLREAVWSLLLSLLAGWVEMIAVTGQLRKLCQS